MSIFNKMKGGGASKQAVKLHDVLWSWLGAFCGITIVALLNYNLFPETDLVFLIGSFGASAVLVYGAIESPLAQPRNLVGGHMISALVGVLAFKLFPEQVWLASSVSVATAIAAMQLTRTLHPPGGATALIAVIGSEKIHALGFYYAFVPVGIGALILLAVALVVNNLCPSRKYPVFWK